MKHKKHILLKSWIPLVVFLFLSNVGKAQALVCNDEPILNIPMFESRDLHPSDVAEGISPTAILSFSPTDPNDTIRTYQWNDPSPSLVTIHDLSTSNTCWGNLIIVNCDNDTSPPVAIANVDVNLSLAANGSGFITPDMIDEGSYDLCSGVDLLVKRWNGGNPCDVVDTGYTDKLLVCCADIDQTILVELLVTDASGNTNFAITSVIVENKLGDLSECFRSQGYVYLDDNNDCDFTTGETIAPHVIIKATDGTDTHYSKTDLNGYYYLYLPEGTWDVSAVSPSHYWDVCNGPVSITVNDANPKEEVDFGLTTDKFCSELTVNLSANRIRRCRDNDYTMTCQNVGTVTAFDPYVVLELDKWQTLISASHPYATIAPQIVQFDIRDLDPFDVEKISMKINVDCDSTEEGMTLCTEAEIFPDTLCYELNPIWNGANIEVEAVCDGDSVRLKITNTGVADMVESQRYYIVEDDVILFMKDFKLDKDEHVSEALSAEGSTYRVSAEQVSTHPFQSMVSRAIEACGRNDQGEFSTGFMAMAGMGAASPNEDVLCIEITGSYDPNEKKAFPIGKGDNHQILPEEIIDYTIFFQNTGNDTAFNVSIIDTLSEHLDFETFKPGPSSHNYTWTMLKDRALKFDFKDIMLADSNVNEPASHGHVEYTIHPKEGVELKTVITNEADIYFDFNDPIRTNQVYHTIDTGFIEVITGINGPGFEDTEVKVYPNPFKTQTNIVVDNDDVQNLTIEVFDVLGKLVKKESFRGNHIVLNNDFAQSGIFNYRLSTNGMLVSTGRIIVAP